VALNLIESLRNTETGRVGSGSQSHVWRCEIPQLARESFLEEAFAFLTKRAYYVLHEVPLLSQDFFLSARTPHHGVDAGCGGEP
jgi:hypothetical protein